MDLIKNLFKGKIKLIFKKPPNTDILIFDDTSFEDLKFFIEKKNYFLLPTRQDRIKIIYINLKFFINFVKLFMFQQNKRGLFLTAYFVSIIETIKPKVVVSHIDNSIKYSDVSFFLKDKFKFLTIQNASRYDALINHLNFEKNLKDKLDNYKLFIQNYCCLGQWEIDCYTNLKHQVDHFHKIGSIRKSNFFRYLEREEKKLNPNLFKLGVLLEIPLPTPGLIPKTKDHIYSFVMPIIYSIKYAKKNKIKPIFICKTKEVEDQFKFYENYLSEDEKKFIKKNLWKRKIKEFSSYEGVFQSEVVVGMASTLLREKISSKEKVLSCNYTQSSFWNFPIDGICLLKEDGYQNFESRLDKIFSISPDEYFEQLSKDRKYVCNQESDDSALREIDNLVAKFTV